MPTVYLKKDSGGAVLMEGGGVAIAPGCCCASCDPPHCFVDEISLQATISGNLFHRDDGCGAGDPFDISAESETVIVTREEFPCLLSCITEDVPLEYTCDASCDPFTAGESHTFRCEVILSCPGTPEEDWFLIINAGINNQGEAGNRICNREWNVGGPDLLEINIGPDPDGPHILSFADPNIASVQYDIVVDITKL